MSQTKAQLIDPVDGTIVNADINASAAIAGSKISPDFGSQNITTTGQLFSSYATLTAVNPTLTFTDSNNNPDYTINVNSGALNITDSTNSADRLSINSSGNVGIGTASPETLLHAKVNTFSDDINKVALTLSNNQSSGVHQYFQNASTGTGVSNGARIGLGNTDNFLIQHLEAKDIQISTNGTERMRIDSSGSVGIGTTSPSANLESEGNVSSTTQFSGFQGLRIQNANGSTHGLTADINMVVGTGTNNRGAVIGVEYSSAASGNDLYFATNPNAVTNSDAVAERMRITSAGKVGIGTTSPSTTLHLDSASTPTTIQIDSDTESSIDFNDHGGSAKRYKIGTNISSNDGQFEIKDMTANAERMRIDSAGTIFSFSTNDTTPNIKWRSDDTNWFGSLNQSVEGGTISTFLSVGGDWTANGTTYSATKAIANFETRAIVLHPQFNNGAGKVAFLQKAAGSSTTDGTVTEILKIDNDGIKFGTDTAAANALDDYEEGTFTPSFGYNQANFNGSYSAQGGSYTKIGNTVNVRFQIAASKGTGTGGTATVYNLPFTVANVDNYRASGVMGYYEGFTDGKPIIVLVEANQNQFPLRHSGGTNAQSITASGMSSSFRFYISITYQVA